MKTKFFIIGALVILILVIGYILLDLFNTKPVARENPFDYGMDEIRKDDTTKRLYTESGQITPGLQEIRSVAVTGNRILVAGSGGVEIYNPEGNITGHFPVEGNPGAIAIGKEGRIWLGVDDHIEIFDTTGRLIKRWKPAGESSVITSIALTDRDLFVADAGYKVVYRYDHNARLVNRIGEKDPQNNIPGFVIPSPYFDLGVDPDGSLWVVNPGRHQFEKYTTDGKLLGRWGTASNTDDGFCGCCNPSNFARLTDGSFVTSEKGIERVKLYTPGGNYTGMVAPPGSFDEGTKGIDLAVDPAGRILVLDPVRKQVRIFVRNRGAEKN